MHWRGCLDNTVRITNPLWQPEHQSICVLPVAKCLASTPPITTTAGKVQHELYRQQSSHSRMQQCVIFYKCAQRLGSFSDPPDLNVDMASRKVSAASLSQQGEVTVWGDGTCDKTVWAFWRHPHIELLALPAANCLLTPKSYMRRNIPFRFYFELLHSAVEPNYMWEHERIQAIHKILPVFG